MRFPSLLRPFAALAVASCDSPSGPSTRLPARLDVVSGSGQEGTVGSVFAGTTLTDARGEARERWTLGTSSAGSQRVEARVVDPTTGRGVVLAFWNSSFEILRYRGGVVTPLTSAARRSG